jgi:molybdenum cofactor synthesis domain-containing protein
MTLLIELLIIGNEILSGRTLDTNSQWLAQRLFTLGLPVNHIQVVEDNPARIAQAIQDSRKRNTTILLTSGGLGPTFDDLTAQGLALAAEAPIKLQSDALEMVTRRYHVLKRQGLIESETLTPSRQKMAHLPEGAVPIPNQVGTAPGIHMQLDSTTIYSLPGVPEELYSMFLQEVAPRIANLSKQVYLQEVITVNIYEEAMLAPLLEAVMAGYPDAYLKSLPQPHVAKKPLEVIVTVSSATVVKAEKMMQEVTEALLDTTQS